MQQQQQQQQKTPIATPSQHHHHHPEATYILCINLQETIRRRVKYHLEIVKSGIVFVLMPHKKEM